jgi:glycosyltransferase involved in cell wall biosynthesis
MGSDGQPLVSVVTPVYNGDKFLAECIESVLAQTYRNWEYIIVDNCSTDRTKAIAERYAHRDTRIRIYHNQEFVSATQNHNIAFRQMSPRSKYCKVVHADDWLFPECIMQMVKVAETNPSVGIVGAYRLDGVRVNLHGLPHPSTVVPGWEICRLTLLRACYVFGSPTSILIRSDLIRNRKAFYNESHIHADKEACFDVLQDTDFGFVHQVLTFTRRHTESETSFSKRLNTYLLGNLIILTKYGPLYLDESEYQRCLNRHMKNYYRFLGKSVFHLKGKEFWDYHKNGLSITGFPLSLPKLIGASALEMMDLLFNPKKTVEKILGRIIRGVQEKQEKSHEVEILHRKENYL